LLDDHKLTEEVVAGMLAKHGKQQLFEFMATTERDRIGARNSWPCRPQLSPDCWSM
jgi:hypothetical protein